jgi:hypothetical protein
MFIKITNVQQGSLQTLYLDQDCIISLTPINYGINSDGSTKNYCTINYSVGNAVATAIVAYPPDVMAEYCLYVEQNYYNVDKFAQIKSLDEFVSDKDRPEVATVVVPPQKFDKRERVTISNPNDPLYKEKGQIDNFQRVCIYTRDRLIGLENKYQIEFLNSHVLGFSGGWYNENDLTATPTPPPVTRKTEEPKEELELPPPKFYIDDPVKIVNKKQECFFGAEGSIQEFQQNVKWEEGVPKIVNMYYVSVPTSLHDGHHVWFQECELELLPPSPQETPQCNGNGKVQSKEE